MCPDLAIYWTLGNFSKPVATISLPKSHTFLGNFYKGAKIFNFSGEIILGNILLVTLVGPDAIEWRRRRRQVWWWFLSLPLSKSKCSKYCGNNMGTEGKSVNALPRFESPANWRYFHTKIFYTSGQSYKASTSTNNDSRVALRVNCLFLRI